MKKTYGLIILDGFGINKETYGNAIKAEGVPYFHSLQAKYPHTQIGASGMDVGLPDGQMGNSEVTLTWARAESYIRNLRGLLNP